MSDTTLVPLDPEEGPTAWLRIEMRPEHAEKAEVDFLMGQNPSMPTREIKLNRREALLAASTIQSTLSEQ